MLRCALVVMLLACGGRPPAPPPAPPPPADAGVAIADTAPPVTGPLDRDLDRLAERSVALYAELARVLDAAGESCGTAAAKLEELTRGHAEVIAANAKVLQEGREMQLKIALRRFDDRFQQLAKAIVQSKTIAACFQDAAFAKALDGLVGPRP